MTNGKTLTNGRASAALLAGGIGSFSVGLMTTLAAASKTISSSLNWFNPVGPLSGKTSVALIIWLVLWLVFNQLWKNKETQFEKIASIAMVLLILGFLLTFPPFFDLFAAE